MRIVLVIAGLLFAHPAFAMTGKEAWQSLQMQLSQRGWMVEQSRESAVPDGVRVGEVVVANDDGMKVAVASLTFTGLAGGDVKVGVGKIEVFLPLITKPRIEIAMDGAYLIVSPDSGSPALTFAADKIDAIMPTWSDGGTETLGVGLAFGALTGRFAMAPADARQMIPIEVAFDAATTRFQVHSGQANRDGIDAAVSGLDFDLTARMPAAMAGNTDMTTEEEFKAGFSFETTLKHDAINGDLELDENVATVTGLGCTHGFTMDYSGFSIRDACGAGEVRIKSAQMPTESGISLQKLLLQITGPVNSMQAPGNLNFLFTLEDAAVSDAVWAMIDTKKALPHEPMDFAMDLGMLARWNIFDDATTDDFKPEAVDLRRFEVKAAGVEAAFSGHGTVDGLAGEDDVPFTEAVLDGKVSGLNRLLNAVADAGLVAAGDLFPMRMGLSMIFNPGSGEDVLTTHVETRQGGEIFINGLQVK